jgi:hypothetical protein
MLNKFYIFFMNKTILTFVLLFCSLFIMAQPAAPTLIAPSNTATKQKVNTRLLWVTPVGATRFHYQIDTVNTFNSALLLQDTITNNEVYMDEQYFGKKYFWRVRAGNSSTFGNWSSAFSYTTYAVPSVYTTTGNILTSGIVVHQIMGSFVEYQFDTSKNFNSPAYRTFTSTYKDSAFTNFKFLKYNTNYYIRARGVHAKDTSPFTSTFNRKTLTAANYKPSSGSTQYNFSFPLEFNRTTASKDTTEKTELQIDSTALFNSPILYTSVSDTTVVNMPSSFPLQYGKTYYWRTRCMHPEDTSAWVLSTFNMFTAPQFTLGPPVNNRLNPNQPILTVTGGVGTDFFIVSIDTVNTFTNPIYTDTFSGALNPTKQLPFVYFNRGIYFRLYAVRGSDTSLPATTYVGTVQGNTLSAPPSSITLPATQAVFRWQKVDGSNYEIEIDTAATFNTWRKITIDSITADSVLVHNLPYGKQFYWRVRMTNPVDKSPWTASRTFYTKATVTQLWPSDNAKNFIINESLSCEVIEGSLFYEFSFSEDSLFTSFSNDTSSQLDAFGDVDLPMARNNLKYLTKYFWKVRAINGADTSKWSKVWRFTTRKQLLAPTKPILISPAHKTEGLPFTPYLIKLKWQLQPDVDFELQIAKTLNFSNIVEIWYVLGNANDEIDIDSLAANTTYYWRVRATNGEDTSAWSDTWYFTTLPAIRAPFLLTPDGVTNVSTKPTLDWEDIDGATGYRFGISTSQTLSGVTEVTVTNSEAVVNLQPNTNYYWRVISFNNYYVTNYAFTASFKTGNATGIDNTPTIAAYCYPNPATNTITVSVPNNPITKVDIYNLQGQLCQIYLPNTITSSNNININLLATGLYIAHIHTENATHTLRFTKE